MAIILDISSVPARSTIHPALYVGASTVAGMGVRTHRALAKGTTVIVWGGTVFSQQDVLAGLAQECESAWNVDPLTGDIGV
jgi:hypothetical protein